GRVEFCDVLPRRPTSPAATARRPPGPGFGATPGGRRAVGAPPRGARREVLAQRGLRRRQPRDRQPIWRAGYVVEAEAMAEAHRTRIAAVFAADADLQTFALGAAALDGDAHQLADAFFVDRLERIARIDLEVVHVRNQEAAGIVA